MNGAKSTNRRAVLKTLGAGVVGGSVIIGTVSAHGSEEDWGTPAWLLTDVWEMADREPSGEDPTDHNSHVPIYYIAPGAAPDGNDMTCAQVTKDFSRWESLGSFKDGAWESVPVDQTLHDLAGTDEPPKTEFTTLWHEHFVFDKGAYDDKDGKNLVPTDLVNVDHIDRPLIDSGRRIQAANNVKVLDVPMVFNCPARPAQGDHLNYCK